MNLTSEEAFELLRKHVAQLSEHFESVHVFVSVHDGDHKGTFALDYGSGNFYARYGQVKEWIEKNDERTRNIVRVENSD
jgi:hypothetical protein